MGETFNKSIISECPTHKIPYSGVCIEKNCYETGLICPRCNPNSCIETKGHKKMFTNEFYKLYIENLVHLIDFRALNDLISIGLEVQQKQLELQSQAFEEWEIKMIDEKFNKFKEHMNKKIQNFINKLAEKLQNIYDDFINSNQALKNTIVEIPDFKIDNTIKFLNENKDNKEELEKFMDTIKKVMDNDKLMKYQKDLKNVIYGKYLFEHLKNNENSVVGAINLKNDINEYVQKIIKSIFPEEKGIKIYINQNTIDFTMDPRELKYKETITNKCLKSYTIDCIFDAFTAFDGNCYLASSHGAPYSIEIYDLSDNKLKATLNVLKQIYIIRHFAQFSKRIDYLLTTTTEKSIKIFNLNTFKEYLTISNCYTGTYMYSALLLFDDLGEKNKNYVVTSSPNDYIKFWNLDNGKFIKNVGSKEDYTYFINYWKNNDKYYILNANADNVKIYGTESENQLFGEYSGTERTWHMCAFVEKMNDVDTLFESDGKGYVRLWNLETHQLIKSIQCQSISLRGMSLWNQKYIIVASSDKSFKILDLEKGELVSSVSGQHNNSMCSVKKIMHPLYGESLLTGSIDGTIKLWINKSLVAS